MLPVPNSKYSGSLDGSVAGIVLNIERPKLELMALSGAGARNFAIPLTTDDIWLG
jgi:hypothetical protein